MAAKKSRFVKTAGTSIKVSKDPTEDLSGGTIQYSELADTIKELNWQPGAKTENDVTTLASEGQETTGGLPNYGDFSASGNWDGKHEGQQILCGAYDTGATYAFQIMFKDGTGFNALGEVTQYTVKAGVNGVIEGTFNIKFTGKATRIVPAPIEP